MVRLHRAEGYSVRMKFLMDLWWWFLTLIAVLAFPPVGYLVWWIVGKIFDNGFNKGFKEGLTEGLERREREIERLKERLYDAGLDDD